MAGEPVTTIVGNITADPELRFTPSGAAVANFTVASTPRTRNGDQWEDGETMFVNCAVWRQMAENVAESLQKGQRVLVLGRLKTRAYETRDGEKRTSLEMEVDAIGHDLRFGSTRYFRADGPGQDRRNAPDQRGQQQQRPQQGRQPRPDPWAGQDPWAPAQPAQPAQDPWAAPPTRPTGGQDPWASSPQSEPPY